MEPASSLTSAHVQVAKSPPLPPKLGTCTPHGSGPRLMGWHRAATHKSGWRGCFKPLTPNDRDAAGVLRGGSGAIPHGNRGAVCPPCRGWLFICSQSCLHQRLALISTTDTHTHTRGAPSPAATPGPQVPPGLCRGRRRRGERVRVCESPGEG